MDLFILSMFGANIVIIGAQWLKSLGPVTTDLGNLCMKFMYKEKPISWTGCLGFLMNHQQLGN